MNIFEIQTTAFSEENFTICTDLSHAQIIKVIEPIVLAERKNEDSIYYNHTLVAAIREYYPNNLVVYKANIDKIVI